MRVGPWLVLGVLGAGCARPPQRVDADGGVVAVAPVSARAPAALVEAFLRYQRVTPVARDGGPDVKALAKADAAARAEVGLSVPELEALESVAAAVATSALADRLRAGVAVEVGGLDAGPKADAGRTEHPLVTEAKAKHGEALVAEMQRRQAEVVAGWCRWLDVPCG